MCSSHSPIWAAGCYRADDLWTFAVDDLGFLDYFTHRALSHTAEATYNIQLHWRDWIIDFDSKVIQQVLAC